MAATETTTRRRRKSSFRPTYEDKSALDQYLADVSGAVYVRGADVLPVDDLGIRKGAQLVDRLDEMPRPRPLAERGERWGPYRTLASLYLWRCADLGAAPVKRSQG